MSHHVYVQSFPPPPISRREILRYMGASAETAESAQLLDGCLGELLETLSYKVCYCELPLQRNDTHIDLGFASVSSAALAKNLDGCHRIAVFAATVGLSPDRLITRFGTLSPARALCCQAIGTERIEALCDSFEEWLEQQLSAKGEQLRPRFSPGYGDLPLTLQHDIFRLLDPARRIGLTLNESCLMTPTKSVTAIIGITKNGSLT